MMKTIVSSVLAAVLLLGALLPARAVCGDDWREKLESEKIAFLTREMNLTPEEAQVFWPLYNEAQQAKRSDFEASVEAYKALQKAIREGADDAAVAPLLKNYLDCQGKGDEIDRSYADKYLKVLPASKVARLFLAEEKFRRQQIRKLHRGERERERK